MRGVNWIPDENPHSLEPPPSWFLDELWTFDSQLVIMPTCDRVPIYRLTRRTKNTAGFKFMATLLKGLPMAPDTRMMARHATVPVASLPHDVTWGPRILFELAERDTWRVGSGEKAADILDAQDKARKEAIDRKIDDELTQRVEASYDSYRYRTGQRLSLTRPSAPIRTLPSAPSEPKAVS